MSASTTPNQYFSALSDRAKRGAVSASSFHIKSIFSPKLSIATAQGVPFIL
jgi:hypothetical protein